MPAVEGIGGVIAGINIVDRLVEKQEVEEQVQQLDELRPKGAMPPSGSCRGIIPDHDVPQTIELVPSAFKQR